MKVLIAEDSIFTSRMLELVLTKWEYEVITCTDGTTALEMLLRADAPKLAILDWMIPGMSGVEICRNLRLFKQYGSMYIIILTAKDNQKDVATGLWAGADDYITKPVMHSELRARLHIGQRTLELHEELADKVKKLEDALSLCGDHQDLEAV